MNFPKADIRSAVKTALSAGCTYPVYDIPVPETVSYINIQAIRISEDTAQSWPVYDCYVTIEIISTFQKTGNRTNGDAQAELVDTAMRPTVTGGIVVAGWDLAGCWLDSQDEYLSNDADGKKHRIVMSYFLKYCKS